MLLKNSEEIGIRKLLTIWKKHFVNKVYLAKILYNEGEQLILINSNLFRIHLRLWGIQVNLGISISYFPLYFYCWLQIASKVHDVNTFVEVVLCGNLI